MWIGAIKGFAWLKFSTSPNRLGKLQFIKIIIVIIINKGKESFNENIGLNFTLSKLVIKLEGFEEPFSCKRIKWKRTITEINIGKRKCSEKKSI